MLNYLKRFVFSLDKCGDSFLLSLVNFNLFKYCVVDAVCFHCLICCAPLILAYVTST